MPFHRVSLSRLASLLAGWLLLGPALAGSPDSGGEAVLRDDAAEGRAVLYLFAHQDDEYFILARMARDVARGRQVHAVWITDGAKRGSAHKRNAESEAVMTRLGVSRQNLHFLGFPDQDSIHHLAEINARVRALAKQHDYAEITTPAYEGGNVDHDIAALIGALLAGRGGDRVRHYEYPLYNHFRGRGRVGVFLPNSGGEVQYTRLEAGDRALLREAMRMYRSQRLLLFALRFRSDRKALRELGEPYRVAPTYDFLARPANELCGYEVVRRRRAPFDRWLEAVRPFLAEIDEQA